MSIIRHSRDVEVGKIFRLLSMEIKGCAERPNVVNLEAGEGEVFKVWIGLGTYEELRIYDLEEKIVFIKFDKVSTCCSSDFPGCCHQISIVSMDR